jgi:hypothetical protein
MQLEITTPRRLVAPSAALDAGHRQLDGRTRAHEEARVRHAVLLGADELVAEQDQQGTGAGVVDADAPDDLPPLHLADRDLAARESLLDEVGVGIRRIAWAQEGQQPARAQLDGRAETEGAEVGRDLGGGRGGHGLPDP